MQRGPRHNEIEPQRNHNNHEKCTGIRRGAQQARNSYNSQFPTTTLLWKFLRRAKTAATSKRVRVCLIKCMENLECIRYYLVRHFVDDDRADVEAP